MNDKFNFEETMFVFITLDLPNLEGISIPRIFILKKHRNEEIDNLTKSLSNKCYEMHIEDAIREISTELNKSKKELLCKKIVEEKIKKTETIYYFILKKKI
jgi:hypothetical protein